MGNTLELKKKIYIEGWDPFGRKAWIEFEPMPRGEKGIYWKVGSNGRSEYVPIDYRIAYLSWFHNIYLAYKKYRSGVYEHTGVIHFTGLDGYAMSSSVYPPYVTTGFMWNRIKEFVEETDRKITYVEIPCCAPVCSVENGLHRSIQICPGFDEGTILDTTINYAKFGVVRESYNVVTNDFLERIFQVGPQGTLTWQYKLSKILGAPYHKIVIWADDEKDKNVLTQKFGDHTDLDRLGEASLLSQYGLPKCTIVSKQAGHWHALKMIKMLGPKIRG